MTKKVRDTKTRETDSKGSSSRVSSSGVITLTTDFGTSDYFVGAVKGVILSINRDARIVDLTHEIPPQDIESAAFTLLAAYSSFPAGTIHLAVVDPGVGSSRKPIVIRVHEQLFVGPDNGIFSYVCEGAQAEAFQITNSEYFRAGVSSTFHGRDIFAPVAAALSTGIEARDLGREVDSVVQLPPLRPKAWSKGKLEARIIHIDRFGNCVTNIRRDELSELRGVKLVIKGKKVDSFREFYSQESGAREELFGIWGSAGFLEISAQNNSAAKLLKAKRGDAVVVSKTRVDK